MKRIFTFLFISSFISIATSAQVSYNFTALAGSYSPISGTVPSLTNPDLNNFTISDEGYANDVPIGFAFVYNGTSYTEININANGFISLGEGFVDDENETYWLNDLASGPVSLPNVRPIIAPLWDDLDLGAEDSISYLLSGSSPNRILTVQWANAHWRYNAANAGISFQLKLYETTNVIEFVYRQETGTLNSPSASIGLSGSRIGLENFLSLSNSSASPVASLTTETKNISAKPATNQVYRFTPFTCIAPSVTQLSNATSTSVTFSWNIISGVANYEYAFSTSSTPPSSGTSVSSNTVNISGLTAGVNNYLYVRSSCGSGAFSSWSMRRILSNDFCEAPITITPASGIVNGNTLDAMPSSIGEICPPLADDPPSDPDDDVWYKFTPVNNGTGIITVTGSANFDAVLSVYTGNCSNLTLLNCIDTTLDGEAEILTLNNLVAGQTYYARVYDWYTENPGDFTISVSGNALPVSIDELHGAQEGYKNILTWKTYTEVNNKGFEIMRSLDGADFNTIDFVDSKTSDGNSSSVLNYRYIDAYPMAGNSYYKLKQIDKDGKFSYSNIVFLRNTEIKQLQLGSIYPNPSKAVLNMVISSPINTKTDVIITDLAGKIILQQKVSLINGINKLNMNIANLSAGSYLAKVICMNNCGSAIRKFVKQ